MFCFLLLFFFFFKKGHIKSQSSNSHLRILLHQVGIDHSWLISGPLEPSKQNSTLLINHWLNTLLMMLWAPLWTDLKQNNQHLLKVTWSVRDYILLYVATIRWRHRHQCKQLRFAEHIICCFNDILSNLPSLYAATMSCICWLVLVAMTSIRHLSFVPVPLKQEHRV